MSVVLSTNKTLENFVGKVIQIKHFNSKVMIKEIYIHCKKKQVHLYSFYYLSPVNKIPTGIQFVIYGQTKPYKKVEFDKFDHKRLFSGKNHYPSITSI